MAVNSFQIGSFDIFGGRECKGHLADYLLGDTSLKIPTSETFKGIFLHRPVNYITSCGNDKLIAFRWF